MQALKQQSLNCCEQSLQVWECAGEEMILVGGQQFRTKVHEQVVVRQVIQQRTASDVQNAHA